MVPTNMTFGAATVKAALPWASLAPSILSRTCFFHHATYTNAHGDAPKVNRLMGAIQRQEMLVSLDREDHGAVAVHRADPAGGGVEQPDHVLRIGAARAVAAEPPAVLTSPAGALTKLQAMRDADVNALNDLFKSSGNTAQRALLDQYASSQSQARNLSQTCSATSA